MIGKTVSHYQIIRELGAGGMGVVYEAVDTKLDRSVALKFLPPESTRDPEAKARFVHEAKAASAIDHPNVCNIYEIDETEDGHLFLAMARYEGETLKDRIQRGPLLLNDALDITRQVAEGLTKAHERDIVHRDIKPANIFITNDGVVKILDFGLAKLAGLTQLTQEGTTLGTAHYMSPEQAGGQEVDHRSDLWCLGVCLYEMITGRVPFQGDHAQAVTYAILNSDPEPVTGLRTGVPMELERIIGKCLAKGPAERYQHAEDLLADLLHLRRESNAGLTQPMHHQPGADKYSARWKLVLTIGLFVVALAVVGWMVLQSDLGGRDAEQMSLAVLDFQDLEAPDDPLRSVTFSTLLNVALVEDCPIRVVSGSYLEELLSRRFDSKPGSIAGDQALDIAGAAGASVMLWGRILPGSSLVKVAWELVDVASGESFAAGTVEGEEPATMVDQIVSAALPKLVRNAGLSEDVVATPVSEMTTKSPEALEHYLAGMQAYRSYQGMDALHFFMRAVEIDTTFALAHIGLSKLYMSSIPGLGRDSAMARMYTEQAWRHRLQLSIKDRLLLEAWRHHVHHRSDESLAVYGELLDRYPDDLMVIRDFSDNLFYSWHFAKAVEIAQRGLVMIPDDLSLGTIVEGGLRWDGRLEEAIAANRVLLSHHPQDPNPWDELGLNYLARGYPDSAQVAFNKALTLDPGFHFSREGLALCRFARGDVSGAISQLEDLLARPDYADGLRFNTLILSNSPPSLAGLFAEKGQCRKAMEVHDRAMAYTGQGPNNQTRLVSSRAKILVLMERFEEAVALVDSAPAIEAHLMRLNDMKARALIGWGNIAAADSILHFLEKKDAGTPTYYSYFHALAAEISLARGDHHSALTHLGKIETLKYRLYFLGIQIRMNLARALRMAGDFPAAERELKELLGVLRGHALAYLELGHLYEEMNRLGEAERSYQKFLEMWAEADEDMPQLEEARARLAALRSSP